jgi:pyrimidine-specific ribonucleoside hydrolase
MKRRILVAVGILLGVLVLLVILVWSAAPLWERLGASPVCIQGPWPHLKVVACSTSAGASDVTPLPLPTPSAQGPIPIIVDDDGSPDGMIALLYFLRNPLFEVKAITVSCGEAHPETFAGHLVRLLAGLGRSDIPVGAGRATPLKGGNAFPAPWRQASDGFWGIDYPEGQVSLEAVPAAELIIDTIRGSAQPVIVFVSGTHTNLAEALRLDPGIIGNIRGVHVMGGSIHVPGNIKSDWPAIDNEVAEWNLWVDPVAAREVFSSGLEIHLAPLDSTDQVLWTESDARTWASSGSPEGSLAADLLKWMLTSWSSSGVYLWDLVAAIQTTDPSLCPEVPLSLEVSVATGPGQGQTVDTDGTPNVAACLEPNSEQLRALAAGVLGR